MISVEQRQQLNRMASNLRPENDFSGSGWTVPSEYRYQVFKDALSTQSGGYLGVGSYQNLWMMGQMDAKVAVVVDRDREVTDLMRSLVSSDPQRMSIPSKLQAELANSFSWLSDRQSSERVKTMASEGRIWVVQTDLTNPDLYTFLRELYQAYGVSIGATYLTNAEEYLVTGRSVEGVACLWSNLSRLPFSEDGVILRTFMPNLGSEHLLGDDWDMFGYAVQTAADLGGSFLIDYGLLRDELNWQARLTRSKYIDLRDLRTVKLAVNKSSSKAAIPN